MARSAVFDPASSWDVCATSGDAAKRCGRQASYPVTAAPFSGLEDHPAHVAKVVRGSRHLRRSGSSRRVGSETTARQRNPPTTRGTIQMPSLERLVVGNRQECAGVEDNAQCARLESNPRDHTLALERHQSHGCRDTAIPIPSDGVSPALRGRVTKTCRRLDRHRDAAPKSDDDVEPGDLNGFHRRVAQSEPPAVLKLLLDLTSHERSVSAQARRHRTMQRSLISRSVRWPATTSGADRLACRTSSSGSLSRICWRITGGWLHCPPSADARHPSAR